MHDGYDKRFTETVTLTSLQEGFNLNSSVAPHSGVLNMSRVHYEWHNKRTIS